jgi:hypothetical protein
LYLKQKTQLLAGLKKEKTFKTQKQSTSQPNKRISLSE